MEKFDVSMEKEIGVNSMYQGISCPFTIVLQNDTLRDKLINLKLLCDLCRVVLNPASASFF